MTRRLMAVALVAVAGLGLLSCGDDDGGGSGTAAVTVSDAWARTSPANATVGAAYMTLESDGGDTLLSASVPASVAAKVEIHETMAMGGSDTTMAGSTDTTMAMGGSDTTMGGSGAMTMQPVASLPLPAGETVALEPGGYHLMLVDLAAPLQQGETVEITLTFEKAGAQAVQAEVRDTAP